MTGLFLIGVGVLIIGFIVQRIVVHYIAHSGHKFPKHLNTDIARPQDALSDFFNRNLTNASRLYGNYLWALLGDGLPCAIAYGENGIAIYPAELNGTEIIRRAPEPIVLTYHPQNIKNVWLLRKDDTTPVYEIHIQYVADGVTTEIRIYRFKVNVDASLNLHHFRAFAESLLESCRLKHISIRDFIRQ